MPPFLARLFLLTLLFSSWDLSQWTARSKLLIYHTHVCPHPLARELWRHRSLFMAPSSAPVGHSENTWCPRKALARSMPGTLLAHNKGYLSRLSVLFWSLSLRLSQIRVFLKLLILGIMMTCLILFRKKILIWVRPVAKKKQKQDVFINTTLIFPKTSISGGLARFIHPTGSTYLVKSNSDAQLSTPKENLLRGVQYLPVLVGSVHMFIPFRHGLYS